MTVTNCVLLSNCTRNVLHLSFNRKRIQGKTSRLDPVSEQVISELKNQNEELQSRMCAMDRKMKQILDLVQEIHSKNF